MVGRRVGVFKNYMLNSPLVLPHFVMNKKTYHQIIISHFSGEVFPTWKAEKLRKDFCKLQLACDFYTQEPPDKWFSHILHTHCVPYNMSIIAIFFERAMSASQ